MLSYLDYIVSLSYIATEQNYVKPDMSDNNELVLLSNRHPVIESIVETYIPNDVFLKDQKFKLLTGPNMG
jgi:DNA mismatch repair protein MutS